MTKTIIACDYCETDMEVAGVYARITLLPRGPGAAIQIGARGCKTLVDRLDFCNQHCLIGFFRDLNLNPPPDLKSLTTAYQKFEEGQARALQNGGAPSEA